MSRKRPFLFLSARPEDDAVGPEYQAMLTATGLEAGELQHHRLDLEPLPPLPLEGYSGVIVGGSPFNVTSDPASKSETQRRVENELSLLADWAVDAGLPALFTCYGIGLLTERQGGVVGTEYGEEAGPVTVTLTAEGRDDPLLAGLNPSFTALTGHKEATSVLPESATLLATSDSCPVQIYRVGSSVYATQFHPEVLPQDFIARAHVYREHGYFPAHELEDVVARLAASVVTEPALIMSRFVQRFARPAA
ncbi:MULTISPECIES: glutamine amidotransferase [Microterricola]|uniref:GMP synthase (Glutamine-hydrolysing) n=2 Tax=Microterricola TaxID=518733 RepID=A0A1H1PMG0_9MICO|nr:MULTISPECIES: glutamine amidotransferase [Microterricola]PPL19158.1 glutamine amidotransferase [Microterricola pindariensis]SDS11899.1 GMP synthase (glutamine-hydrolysing) [Microterricola viridarii]